MTKMNQFEIIQNVIRLAPFLVMVGLYSYLLKQKWYFRTCIMVLIGWAVILGSTLFFWSYSIEYAPSEEIKRELVRKDGGPKAFVLLFGWVYALIVLALFELVRILWLGLRKVIHRITTNA